MEKLEIKHLKGYLGCGLKFVLTHDKTEDFFIEDYFEESLFVKGAVWDLIGYVNGKGLNIYIGEGTIDGFLLKNDTTYVNFHNGVKPILYPLSWLTKFREDLGFVPIERLSSEAKVANSFFSLDTFAPLLATDYLKLQEWKFDINGLIEKGLAIPVTDDFNPYID